jgi:hypothetical protein
MDSPVDNISLYFQYLFVELADNTVELEILKLEVWGDSEYRKLERLY